MTIKKNIDVRRIEVLDEAIVELLRAKTPAQRVAMVFDAERTMRLMLEAQIRSRHPDWDDDRVLREIARRWNPDLYE
jgi:hypothetical protein